VDTDEFAEIDLFNEPFWLTVPANNPLAQKQQADLGDLNHLQMLLLEEGHCLRGQALDICVKAGASEYAGFQATSLETLRHMVGEGMGITLMPELAVHKSSSAENIRYLPFIDPKPSRRIGVLYRKGSYRHESYVQIVRTIQEAIPVMLDQ
ncbi:MAG: LysR substrate-binding domain-containing protein, partial [Gammaproteobacteria bacterium]|nr:LysR substrate-binding domain-containing protein [Gammaproteobacteria bacterium]